MKSWPLQQLNICVKRFIACPRFTTTSTLQHLHILHTIEKPWLSSEAANTILLIYYSIDLTSISECNTEKYI
jgi:hypothetical protein